MAEEVNGNIFPDHILFQIFSYLPAEDLVSCIPRVCRRWSELVRYPVIWNDVIFEPPEKMSDDEIVRVIKNAPFLKHLRLNHAEDFDFVLGQLTTGPNEVRSLVVKWKKGPNWSMVAILLDHYAYIQKMEFFVHGRLFTLDYAKFFSTSVENKLFLFTKVDLRAQERYGIELVKRMECISDLEIVRKNLRKHCNTLRHLGIGNMFTQIILDVIYHCNQLRSLFIFSSNGFAEPFNLGGLSCAAVLQNLHIFLDDNLNIGFNPGPDFEFPRLVKLEIFSFKKSYNITGLLAACKNLEFLRLKSNVTRPNDLDDLNKCTKLKYLDLSCSSPGFGNDSLQLIGQSCRQLEFLDLSYSLNPKRYNLSFLSLCRKLKYLRLSNHTVTDDDLNRIPNLFLNLLELTVAGCTRITEAAVNRLKSAMPRLRVVLSGELTENEIMGGW